MFNLKKSISPMFLFALKISVFLLFLLDLFPAILGNATQRYAQAQACLNATKQISTFCTQNKQLIEADAETMAFAQAIASSNSIGTAEQVLVIKQRGNSTKTAIIDAKKACEQANKQCQKICETEKRNYMQTCEFDMTGTCTQDLNQRYEGYKQQCTKEYTSAQNKMNFSLGEIGKLLAGVGALLSALGVNKDDGDVNLDDIEDDECKGPDADKIVRCGRISEPIQGRAGTTRGPGGLSGPGGGLDGLFTVSSQGEEPGGERGDGDGSRSATGNNAGGGSGWGGGPSGDGLASANGESENGGSSEDDSEGEQYMGTGGGGGGGSGGYSGGGRGGLGNFGNFSSNGDKLASQSELDKNLKKYSNANARGPASVGGAVNGPFQDNWEVIKKAYKKNSNTLLLR